MIVMSQKEHLYDLYRPSHYNIYLDINREKKVFSGKVSIEGEALDSNIGINEKYMNITSVSVNGKDAAFIYDKDNEAIRIEVNKLGSATLEI